MRKNRILAAVCSLIFVMNCSACSGREQEVLLIGQQEAALTGLQEAGQEAASAGLQEAGQGAASVGQQEAGQGAASVGQQEAGQGAASVGQQGTGQGAASAGQQGTGGIRSPGPEQEICVYVCGAVKSSGVVFLPDGSRAADALEAAGGFASDAAQEAVNLAARVSDGEKLYFPTSEEYVSRERQEEAAEAGLVNINTADISQLCTLPGIGESRAADIIAYREAHGNFAACEDIMQVSGIKESVYNKISGKITVK